MYFLALTVIACDFAESRLCENGNKKSTFFIYGWSRAEDFDLKGRKSEQFLSNISKTLSLS